MGRKNRIIALRSAMIRMSNSVTINCSSHIDDEIERMEKKKKKEVEVEEDEEDEEDEDDEEGCDN